MHLRGKDYELRVTYPTGESETVFKGIWNFDWQVGHWTTTVAFSLALRVGDKETPSATRCVQRSLTHTVACGQMAPYRFASMRSQPPRTVEFQG